MCVVRGRWRQRAVNIEVQGGLRERTAPYHGDAEDCEVAPCRRAIALGHSR